MQSLVYNAEHLCRKSQDARPVLLVWPQRLWIWSLGGSVEKKARSAQCIGIYNMPRRLGAVIVEAFPNATGQPTAALYIVIRSVIRTDQSRMI